MSSMHSLSWWPLVGHEGWPPNIKPSPGDFVASTYSGEAWSGKPGPVLGIERCPEVGRMSLYDAPWDGMYPIDRMGRWVSA